MRSECCSTPPPSTPAAPAERSSPSRPTDDGPPDGPRRARCSTWSASPAPRPTGGSATTPSGCGSGSASPPRSSVTRRSLILDEPANGLDPAGIRWMRDLLRGYADRGGTVLLSSHLLHEIEIIADDLVVIGNGRIVAQGTKSDLLQTAGTVVRTPRPAALDAAMQTRRPPSHAPRRRRAADRCRPGQVGEIALARRPGAHRAPNRRRCRTGGDVPRAHRRHPARRSSSMTATAVTTVRRRARVHTRRPAVPVSRC